MSFDRETLNALARMVAACRRRLTEDVENQLQQTFGLYLDGTILPLSQLTHLTEEQKVAAQALRELLNHFKASDPQKSYQSAYNRTILEISFTILNRLAALRLCEERNLVIECVRKGMESDGFRLFERLANGSLGSRYETYRVFVESIFDELAVDLGVLFDRTTPQSTIFPSDRVLTDVFDLLNDAILRRIWTEDETIGWIYQYFNPPEERRAMREASQAPRNSRELAVRNQFFTPRYVVEFLTENTLGRLWYEMRQGDTRLKNECQYFVQNSEQFSVRNRKDPRDIKGLDPASGSGHFLLYAYDLFEVIYQEAWNDENSPPSEVTGRKLQEDFPTLEELHRQLPTLILKYNLHGIDIDARACQIAALALWLRAQRSYQSIKIKLVERPPIQKINIVCAEPMPGEEELLVKFITELNQKRPPIIGELVRKVFEKMNLAGETGALLKIEEEIRDEITLAKTQWLSESSPEQPTLFSLQEYSNVNQLSIFNLAGITDEQFWNQVEGWVVEELQNYANRATTGQVFQRQLFSEDAVQGFAFVDICRKQFDFILMNPLFGDASLPSKSYIEEVYGDTKGDVYKTFVECFQDRLVPGGFLGIISSRAGFFLGQSSDWRERILLRLYRPLLLADLGYGVLDAMVETAAYVLRSLTEEEDKNLTLEILPELLNITADKHSNFSIPQYQKYRGSLKRHQASKELKQLQKNKYINLIPGHYIRYKTNIERIQKADFPIPLTYPQLICFRLLGKDSKENALIEVLQNPKDSRYFIVSPQSFSMVPNQPFCYWVSDSIRRLFIELQPFQKDNRIAKVGASTKKDFRFLRIWSEVLINNLSVPSVHLNKQYGCYCILGNYQWFSFAKGGEYSPYYADLHLVINWQQDGKELKAWADPLYGNSGWSRSIPSVDLYFRPGLTWTRRTTSEVSFRALPTGSIFSDKGLGAFVENKLQWLSLLQSLPFRALISIQVAAADAAARSYEAGLIQRTPIPEISDLNRSNLEKLAAYAIDIKRTIDTANETSHIFYLPAILQVPNHSLSEKVVFWKNRINEFDRQLTEYQDQIDEIAFKLYNISEEDRKSIETTVNFQNINSEDIIEDLEQEYETVPVCDVKELVISLLSYTVGCAFGRWDIRFATGEKSAPELPDPFSPLPVCSPGMLIGTDGLPLSETPAKYTIPIAWDGILVDDPNHPNDITRRVHEVLEIIWKNNASNIEQEACEIIGVRELCDYFQRPANFFQDHLKRYSKSRRKAPIYWPLSTTSGSYTIWIYYHRLTDQTLYTIVNRYLEPKITEVERTTGGLEKELEAKSGREASQVRDNLHATRKFLSELQDMKQELLRVAQLPYKPNLNDGVIITAAPLHRLFGLRHWAQETKKCWESLEKGEYDWAHLAYTIWTNRVREVCKRDKSIAIAHGLEEVYEAANPENSQPKTTKGRSRKKTIQESV
ncbi:Eco57I restriction-modification methylase domain-containing protein [Nostoc sp. 'Peltigera membranacea cyanobiont' 232]|uniref:Eco57I restriction-modification methylase domain-containing protein n=1 Tax=Nostoc sp. 'Peltigera membranacea cyanobiont' 232 TaxID=2014531 RepID=UPI001677FC38|nr:DNA methyltransferase [Nostoc sp. 'Peltigera membranacea cyanobiont' 232]